MLSLDELIKTRSKLFQGVRSVEEDNKLYERVYELCLDEIINFIEENLDEKKVSDLSSQIESMNGKEGADQKIAEIILKAVEEVPDYRFRLYHRLEYFLDKLLVNSLKKKETVSS